MKQLIRRFLASLCCLTLLASLLCASAAIPPSTVHANIWSRNIYVNGTAAEILNAQGKYVEPIIYNGSIYIPHHTAMEWMGCEVNWDQSNQILNFIHSKEPLVRDIYDAPPSTEEELKIMNAYRDNGIDLQIQPNLSVILDGVKQSFTAPNGAPLPLLLFDNSVYLPVRGVGQMMGMDVIYLPEISVPPYQEELISIDNPATPEQLSEMRNYLDQCFKLYQQTIPLSEELTSSDNLTSTVAMERLEHLKNILKQIESLTLPSHTYLNKYHISDLFPRSPFDDYIQSLQSGGLSFQEVKSKGLSVTINHTLQGLYQRLEQAEKALDLLVAAKGGNPS